MPYAKHQDEPKMPALIRDMNAESLAFTVFDGDTKDGSSVFGPIVLVHGDTHFFKIDKPLFDPSHLLKNFTRVQTFGSLNLHWIKVSADSSSRNVFHFEPIIVQGN